MNTYADEFFGKVNPAAIPRGRGSGDKTHVGRKSDAVRSESDYIDYARAKARRENALADIAELDAAKRSGEQVDRAAVRDANAVAFAAIAQTMRSIPDTLERRMALAPEVAEKMGEMIDEALAELANKLEKVNNHGAG